MTNNTPSSKVRRSAIRMAALTIGVVVMLSHGRVLQRRPARITEDNRSSTRRGPVAGSDGVSRQPGGSGAQRPVARRHGDLSLRGERTWREHRRDDGGLNGPCRHQAVAVGLGDRMIRAVRTLDRSYGVLQQGFTG
jgi:hypothetical protein